MKTLSHSFNSMTQQIEAQAAALQRARGEEELRVHERTAVIAQTARGLKAEVAERKVNFERFVTAVQELGYYCLLLNEPLKEEK
jgi:C4-dicarboxylate-specific signal transduction histidine kinase